VQPMEGCRLLYFAKSKNDTKCKNFAVLLCFYINTFIILYFLRWQEGGATASLATPLNSPLPMYFLEYFQYRYMYILSMQLKQTQFSNKIQWTTKVLNRWTVTAYSKYHIDTYMKPALLSSRNHKQYLLLHSGNNTLLNEDSSHTNSWSISTTNLLIRCYIINTNWCKTHNRSISLGILPTHLLIEYLAISLAYQVNT